MYHSFLFLLPLVASFAAHTKGTLIKTSNGTVQGGVCPGGATNYWSSIPFADPPVGELRYQAPQPFSGSFNGTLNGTKTTPICHQFGLNGILAGEQSEDCLYLSIYAPANATSTSALPVKLWIYGGAFQIGGSSDPLYDGCFTSDAVLVTINYRLGPLGYLAVENTSLAGNYGVLDQLQAVRWVHENIAAFGGAPEQILLFGESAGAISTFVLATLPEVKPLINAAVMESGGGITLPTMYTARTFQNAFVGALGCSGTDVNCIRSKDPAQLNTTFHQLQVKNGAWSFAYALGDWNGAVFPWGPLVGSPLFPTQPAQVGVQVPAIFGSNGKEGSLFVLETVEGAGPSSLTHADYEDFLTTNFGAFASPVARAYPPSSFANGVFDAISIVVRDRTFRCTAHRGASLAAAKGLPVWTYSFNQTPTCPWVEGQPVDVLPLLGAPHTAEIAFVFGEVENLPSPGGNCSFTAGEKDISAYIGSAWTDMARNATAGNAWPRFSKNSSLGVNFQGGSVIPGVVDYSMCAFWDKIEAEMLKAATMRNSTVPAPVSGNSASTISASMLWSLTIFVFFMLTVV